MDPIYIANVCCYDIPQHGVTGCVKSFWDPQCNCWHSFGSLQLHAWHWMHNLKKKIYRSILPFFVVVFSLPLKDSSWCGLGLHWSYKCVQLSPEHKWVKSYPGCWSGETVESCTNVVPTPSIKTFVIFFYIFRRKNSWDKNMEPLSEERRAQQLVFGVKGSPWMACSAIVGSFNISRLPAYSCVFTV